MISGRTEVLPEEANIYSKNYKLNINRKEIPIGAVVFFVKKKEPKWTIGFGTIEEHYTHEICIQLYDFMDTRFINGVPYEKFETPTHWKKIPKDFFKKENYDFFQLTVEPLPEIAKHLNPYKAEDIATAIKEGIYVKVQDRDYSHIEVDYCRGNSGYRLVRSYFNEPHHPYHISLPVGEVFKTYEGAQKLIDVHRAEWKRVASLTDLEWSIEQIDNTINRWAYFDNISERNKIAVRERIMNFDNLENVEVRIADGHIQWRYYGRKRWNTILVENE